MIKETAAVGSQAVCVSDGLTDDYERCDGEVLEVEDKNEAIWYAPGLLVQDSDLTPYP